MEIARENQKPINHFSQSSKFAALSPYIKYFFLPALAAVFPTLFFYANNVHELLLTHLARTALTYLLLSVVVYLLFLAMYRRGPLKAANATLIFLVFFNLYGTLEGLLIRLDWFPARFYTTLPLILLLVFYSIWLLNKLNDPMAKNLWNVAGVFFVGLVIINLVTIVPAELTKQKTSVQQLSETSQVNLAANKTKPDIYYILLDEFSGFEPMREYWHNGKVDEFAHFLTSRGFEIFEDIHGSSKFTIHQMATRLNYQNYQVNENPDSDMLKIWFDAMADNQVMSYLNQIGYTTITFNNLSFPNPPAKPINSDITYNYNDIPTTNLSLYFDDFWILVAEKTMLKELAFVYKKLGSDPQSNFIFFTINRVSDLGNIPSPKFVYAHLLFPHSPFLFDENGIQNPPSAYLDYRYYLGNYNFSMKIVQQMVDKILDKADPANPPVIILQSDHGVRNYDESDGFKGQLADYPEEYKTSILYARLIPGYESTHSAQESDPINTFPILFNFLFGADIPLQ